MLFFRKSGYFNPFDLDDILHVVCTIANTVEPCEGTNSELQKYGRFLTKLNYLSPEQFSLFTGTSQVKFNTLLKTCRIGG